MSEQKQGPEIVLVGNAHIDMIYRWRLNETLGRVIPDTFRGVLDVMDRDPDLTYAQSQFALYESVKERYPELWQRIRARIVEGRWIVVGGKWVEADSMLPGGESIIRQFLLGRIFAEEEMGIEPVRVAWIPDCFGGHASTTPQIYAGCGVAYYVFNRGCPEDMRCFNWKAPDGTTLFAYKIPEHYNLEITPELSDIVADWCAITGLPEAMILYGEGDHGGGPRDEDLAKVRALQADRAFTVPLTHGQPEPVLSRARDARADWPVFEGDIGLQPDSGVHRGAHISQARIKHWNRVLEHAILQAERLAVLGTLCQRKFFFPRYDLTRLWKSYLLHQFHDTLPGTLVGDAVDDVMRDFRSQHEEALRIRSFGLEAIGARIDTRGDGIPVVVYNASTWRRSGQVNVQIHRPADERIRSVRDDTGTEIPFLLHSEDHASDHHEICLQVADIPSLGFRLYRVHAETAGAVPVTGEPSKDTGVADAVVTDRSARSAETNQVRVVWDDHGLVQVRDLTTGTDLLTGPSNIPVLRTESESSSWHLSLNGETVPLLPVSGPDIIEDSPFRLRVRWVDRSEDSRITRDLVLEAGSPWVACELEVDWHDADRLLTMDFATSIEADNGVFEAPYGWVTRSRDGSYYPMQRWCAVEAPDRGLALLNDGLYSVGGSGGAVSLAIVRGARDMDPRMDEGLHQLRYALLPYDPGDGKRCVIQSAMDFCDVLVARQETRHPGQLPDWGTFRNEGALDSPYSFCSVEAEHSVMTVLKVVEGDWNPVELVLRIYETDGVGEDVTIRLSRPLETVIAIDHIEREQEHNDARRVGEHAFSFPVSPHAIRSFKVMLVSGIQGG